jgi:hypothetical protein
MVLVALMSMTFYTLATPVGADTGDDIVVSGQDEDGNTVQLTYNKDRLLVRSQIAGVGVAYKYSRENLLAYATADNGFGYTVSRDRGQRITQIVGQNSAVMTVTYVGNKKVPTQISMVTSNGQYVTPYVERAGASSTSPTEYSLRAIDMRLAEIFEAYAFASIDYAEKHRGEK